MFKVKGKAEGHWRVPPVQTSGLGPLHKQKTPAALQLAELGATVRRQVTVNQDESRTQCFRSTLYTHKDCSVCLPARMVKRLTFKGDKKQKKRKRAEAESSEGKVTKELKTADVDEDAAEDDTWVSAEAVTDVVGPVMFVLPSDTPTALACDANGKVFTSPIENIVDGNPATAEPHDVRQVWVANRVVGTENFRFKGHHGRYVADISPSRLAGGARR